MADLKTGRRSVKKERFWRGHVNGQRHSGLTIGKYCERHKLKCCTFQWWKRELGRRDAEGVSLTADDAGVFTEVVVRRDGTAPSLCQDRVLYSEGMDQGSGIEVVLRSGPSVRVCRDFDAETLCRVVSVLEGRSC